MTERGSADRTRAHAAASFASFLPRDRLAALARGEPIADRVRGAALLADISGFTQLTVALRSAYGAKRAAEEITRHLNTVYGALIAIVHHRGGSVIGFAGDAITCWFAGDDGGRATDAALAMRSAMADVGHIALPNGDALDLEVKVAVAAGGARRFVVGGVQRIDTLAGRLLDRLGEALAVAGSSDVLVGDEVGGELETEGARRIDGERWRLVSDLAAPPPPPPLPAVVVPAETLRPWLLPRVAEQVAHGDRFLAEVRPVVPLFLRFEPIAFDDDPDAGAALDRYIRFVQQVVDELEGDLIELTIGDKGCYLYIVFGATIAHEDDALRALTAATRLRTPPADCRLGHGPQIGVSAGEARIGAYGSAARCGYGVQGREVNVAARLMSKAAPGEVLVSGAIARAVRRFAFEPRGELTLKGLDRPVQALALSGERELDQRLARHLAPMIGRARERELVHAALERGSRLILIAGEPGIGKSRLLIDVATELEGRGRWLLSGGAERSERARPFNCWVRLLRQLLGLTRAQSGAPVRAAILAVAPGAAPYLALLNGVLRVNADDTPATAALTGSVRAERTIALLVELLAACAAGRPLAFALEDAHWMDPLSLALIEAVVDRLDAVVASTTRDTALEPLGALVERATTVHVGPLDREGAARVAAEALGAEVPDALAGFLFERAEGHPLFSEELALVLRDAGLIEVSDGVCRLAARRLDEFEVPSTVHGVVTSRLDRLSPSLQLPLKVASVIGRTFTFSTLDDIFPDAEGRPALREHLAQLEALDVLERTRPEPDPAYHFRHAIVRDVVYGRMLSTQRRSLHRAVGEWYEQIAGDEPTTYITILAHHWHEVAAGGEAGPAATAKAVGYLERAAGHTTHIGMPRDAVGLGLDAVRLLGVDLPSRIEQIGARIEAGEAAIAEALDGRAPSALLELPAMADPASGRVIEVLLGLMPAAFMAGMPDLFALAAVTNLRLTLERGNGPATPVAHAMYAIIRRNAYQDPEGAHAYSRLALELDERQGGHTFGVVAFIHCWFIDLWKNPLRDAIPLSLRAAHAALAAGDVLYGCYNLSGHVLYSAAAGLALDEVERVSRAQRDAIDGRVLTSVFHCVLELQYAKALSGRTTGPLSLTDSEHDEQGELASICDTDQYNQMAYYHLARLKLHSYYGDWDEACAAGARGLSFVMACGGQVAEMELRFFAAFASLCRYGETGDEDDLARAAEQHAIVASWADHCPANFAHLLALLDGERARVTGDGDAAEPLERAAELARANRYPQHEALALERRARLLGESLEPAAAAFERWGATRLAAHLRQR